MPEFRRLRLFRRAFALLAVAGAAAACQTVGPAPDLRPVDQDALASMTDDSDAASLTTALAQSLKWARTQTPTRKLHLGTRTFTAGELVSALSAWQASAPPNASATDLARQLPRFFDAYRVQEDDGKLLVTGYYVPALDGSLTETLEFHVPVYGVPDDLVTVNLHDFGDSFQGKPAKLRGRIDGHKLVPYWDRAHIQDGALKNVPPAPIAYVKDEIGLFVVEIQGSGVLRLPDGGRKIIGYADENGQVYRPIGRLLLNEGKLSKDKLSMQAIRAYLVAHPEEQNRVLAYNASYVFFHFNAGDVVGSLNTPLTPGRSLATDQKVLPPGVPLFLTAPKPKQMPDGRVAADGVLAHVAFNQDTGGAIKGAAHVDYFWGEGQDAATMAGMMRQQGDLLVFVPKAAPP